MKVSVLRSVFTASKHSSHLQWSTWVINYFTDSTSPLFTKELGEEKITYLLCMVRK